MITHTKTLVLAALVALGLAMIGDKSEAKSLPAYQMQTFYGDQAALYAGRQREARRRIAKVPTVRGDATAAASKPLVTTEVAEAAKPTGTDAPLTVTIPPAEIAKPAAPAKPTTKTAEIAPPVPTPPVKIATARDNGKADRTARQTRTAALQEPSTARKAHDTPLPPVCRRFVPAVGLMVVVPCEK